MDLLAGRYSLVSPLGTGGMGEVFLADDTQLARRVAIKFLHPDHEHDEVARERLRREALAAAALDHPFICKIHEIGDADSRTFIVMEYVEGETLQALARRELLPPRQIVEIANELAQALEEAHHRGVVHRDLKPANVMVTKQGHVKVMDFGLAKHAPAAAIARTGSGASTALTGSGTRLGTPAYMSPEQVAGSTLDARSDMFSLGVMLHELTTGAHPFLRDGAADTMAAILRDVPVRGPRDLDILPGFPAVTDRMLAKACAERYQTMSELRVELEALRDRVWRSMPAAQTDLAPAARAKERTPFVARDAESTELRRLLDAMLAGDGALVLVGGEPGVGKTRLARELLREAQQRGCLCLTGHCTEMEGAAPFAPFIETTEQAMRSVPQATRAAMGELAAELSVVVPSLRRTYGDIPPAPEVPPEQQRRLVFSAYLEYVRRATEKSPAVVLLDDLHWADEPSLQLLSHLAPHFPSMGLLVVGTYRDVELDVDRPFARTLETLLRQRQATRISLRRLTESGVQEMLAARHGSAAPSGFAKIVFRETEGNPFFVEEVYQHLGEEGKLFDERGQWKEDLRVDTIDVPEGVRLVIGRRLKRLGETARRVLTAASVVGRSFALDVLTAIVDASSEDEVLDAIEEAERAQLVAAEPGVREARYAFVHELIRMTLANGLSLPRRQRLHLKIADALEKRHAGSLDSQASVLAHHLYQAGAAADSSRTATFLALAGRRALAASAFEAALEAFDQLISLELPDDDARVAEAFEHRGTALQALQRPDEAIAAFEQALTGYSSRHDDAGIARAAHALAQTVAVWRNGISDAIWMLNHALELLSSGSAVERAILLSTLATLLAQLAQLDDARYAIDEATQIAERLDDSTLLSYVLTSGSSGVELLCLELGAASETARRALPLLRPEALWQRATLMLTTAYVEFFCGRFDDVDALLRRVEKVAERAGAHGVLVLGRTIMRGRELTRTGNLRAYLTEIEGALSTPVPTAPSIILRIHAAMARLYLGQIEEGLDRLTVIVAAPAHRGLREGNLFVANALAGRVDHARTLFPGLEPLLAVPGKRNVMGAWFGLEGAVTGLTILGDAERCGALYPATRAFIETGAVCSLPVSLVNPQMVAGIAAHAAGLVDRAREHFEIATRQARDLPHRLLQPSVLYWYGRMLAEQADVGEQARGRSMIQAAADDFTKLEMVLHARLAERYLRQ